MARKLKPQAAANDDSTPSGVESLSALKPDVVVSVGGLEVTVREYGFFEGLDVAHRASALIADYGEMIGGGEFRYGAARRLFGKHRTVVIPLVAQSAGVEPAFVEALGTDDAEVLLSAWFQVTAGFFAREAVVDARDAWAAATLSPPSTGSTSSPASVITGSAVATSTASESSPNVN